MRSKLWIGALAGASVLAVALLAAEDPVASSDAAPLLKRLASMEAKIQKLEQRVAELEAKPAVMTFAPINPSVPRLTPPSAGPGWKEFEFNGLPYYVVPLKE